MHEQEVQTIYEDLLLKLKQTELRGLESKEHLEKKEALKGNNF